MNDESSSESSERSKEFWKMIDQFEAWFEAQEPMENDPKGIKASLKTHAACMALIADTLIEKFDQLMKK